MTSTVTVSELDICKILIAPILSQLSSVLNGHIVYMSIYV